MAPDLPGTASPGTTSPGTDGPTSALHELRETAGGSLLVLGDPGIGKTTFLRAMERVALHDRERVLWLPGKRAPNSDYALLGDLLEPLSHLLVNLPSHHGVALSRVAQGCSANDVEPPAVATAVLQLLRDLATQSPVVVLIDDAQLLDRPSAAALSFVCRRLLGTDVRLAAAFRPGFVNSLEQTITRRVHLRPLSEDESRSLLRKHHPALSPQETELFLRRACGNPLALIELPRLAALLERPTPLPGAGAIPPTGIAASPVIGLFGPRIAALPRQARELILTAALADTGDLATLSAALADPALDSMAFAERSELVWVDEVAGKVHFCHPLIPATAIALASESQRRAVHQRLAQVSVWVPYRRAWHLAAAAPGPDEPLATALEKEAAASLEGGDAAVSAALLAQAARLSPEPTAKKRREIRAALLGVDVTGDLRSAQSLLAEVNDLPTTLAPTLPTSLATAHLLFNAEARVDDAHRILTEAIRVHTRSGSPVDAYLEEALHALLLVCWFGGRAELWDSFTQATVSLPAASAPLLQLCHRTVGDPCHLGVEALPELTQELDRLSDERDPKRVVTVAMACVYTDRLASCRIPLQRVIDDGRSGGAIVPSIQALMLSGLDACVSGRWHEAASLFAEGHALAGRHNYQRHQVVLGGYLAPLVQVLRGDVALAARAARDLYHWGSDHKSETVLHFADHLMMIGAASDGNFETAYKHAAAIAPAGELGAHNPSALWVLFDLVEAAIATGRTVDARAHVAAMQASHLDRISPRLRMVMAGCAGMTSEKGAADAFAAALAIPQGALWPFDRARLQLAFGIQLRHRRSEPQARDHLAAAAATFRRLGAARWETQAIRHLRASGGELDTFRGEPARADRLTKRERQVAELAAAGLTNREIGRRLFLSPRSVGATLYRVFPKLGITSRASLAAALEALPPHRAPSEGTETRTS